MAGPADIDHVEVARPDDAVEMGIDEIQARRGAPMPEQARLDVLEGQRLAQQRIVEQIDLADREIIRGAPIGVDRGEFGRRQRPGGGISRFGVCVQWLISPKPGRGAAGGVLPLNNHAAAGS